MSWLDGVRQRARMLFLRRQVERELEEELAFHRERDAEAALARGEPPASAKRSGAVRFGGGDRMREAVRDEWPSTLFVGLSQDVRQGVRRLADRPGFAAVALLTLGLGIGANAAIFGLVRGVLMAPLPYGDASRIVHVWNRSADLSQDAWMSARELLEYRAATRSFTELAAYTDFFANLTEGDPERVRAAAATANTLAALGVRPALGRGFRAEEDVPGADDVVLLGHGLWQRRFAAAADIVGRRVRVNGDLRTVIGILPPEFRLPLDYREPQATEVLVPLAIDRTAELPFGDRSLYLVGRLADGVTPEAATADIRAATRRWEEAGLVSSRQDWADRAALPLDRLLFRDVRPALLVLFAAVALVLLIACANVAHLLLARADVRRREVATQVALGASRLRVVRQLLVESGVLAVLGAVAGLAIAWVGVRAAVALTPVQLIRARGVALDPAVVAFAALLAVATTLLAGIVPALQLSRVDVGIAMGTRGDASPMRRRARRSLVVLETALSVLLVIGAVLLARSFAELRRIELGFETDRLLTLSITLPATEYEEGDRIVGFYARLLDDVRRLPGVEAAGAVRVLPLTNTIGDWSITLEDRPRREGENDNGDWQIATPGYIEALGITVVEGRSLVAADDADAPLVVVVNETMAERYWPGRSALGRRFRLGTMNQPWLEIVGVTRDVRHNAIVEEPRAEMVVPHAQWALATDGGTPRRSMTLAIRTSGEPLALLPAVRARVHALDPALPISDVRTMDDVAAAALAQPRFTSTLFSLFGALSLALAGIGLYGVIAYAAARRTREIGIRIALGARGDAVTRMVMGEGVALALAGAVLGLLAAAGATRLLAGQLYGVSPLDPITFAAVPLALLAVAALASWLPARRAARVSPLTALRTD